jgi:hypothetical protein
MAGTFNNRSVAASSVIAGVRRDTTTKPDFVPLEDGKRTDVDAATYNARSCPLFAAGGYLTELITFSASQTKVDHPLNRIPEGVIVAIVMDQPVQLYVYSSATVPMTATQIVVGNDSGLSCRARLWIF